MDLNTVVLGITGQQGGGLVGDLLCSIDNLLPGGLLNQVADTLNHVLDILTQASGQL